MGIDLENTSTASDIEAAQDVYFAVQIGITLQAALEEQEVKNPFKTLEDKEVDTWIIIDGSVTGIETLLNIMTIALQDGRESN